MPLNEMGEWMHCCLLFLAEGELVWLPGLADFSQLKKNVSFLFFPNQQLRASQSGLLCFLCTERLKYRHCVLYITLGSNSLY